jgi:DNA repair protein RecO
MSHHIYHTEALILGTRASGEGDRLLYCYTRDLGLVVAHARSIRESRSRLRYALQTFSHASVDLIRGKYGWKLISATPIASFRVLWAHEARRRVAANHVELTRRLIAGEERHESLFDDLLSGLTFLSSLYDGELLRDAELLLVMRLLHSLGYWGGKAELSPLLETLHYADADLEKVRTERSTIVSCINDSLRSSQL